MSRPPFPPPPEPRVPDPVAAYDVALDAVHIGRSWTGHDLEDSCPCPKEPCGLVDRRRVDQACPQHAINAAKTIRQTHAAHECPAPHEPDEMGAWEEDGSTVWLPRSLYPKRIDAIKWAMSEWQVVFLDVRCLSRWMRYTPSVFAYGVEDFWSECKPADPGAFRVWRLEGA